MQERRGFRRRHLMFHLRVYQADTGLELGTLVNLSPDGLMITGEHRCTIGSTFNMYMALPAGVAQRDRVDFSAQVAWSNNDVNPEFYDTGFRNLEVDPVDREALVRLMEEFDLQDTD